MLAAACAAIAFAGVSGATPLDDEFLVRLDKIGITTSNPFATVVSALGVCRQLRMGTPHSRVVDFILSQNPSLDRDGAADYVVVAYMTYCPDKTQNPLCQPRMKQIVAMHTKAGGFARRLSAHPNRSVNGLGARALPVQLAIVNATANA
ncbi:DUF732 domain-containing protein [Mycolicibacterium sp.]|uniref:DUF732 domain-containing protein n=1 Tax=Mycolicibacterium sp. TaxID=2320850 RepID=UPI003D0DF2EF